MGVGPHASDQCIDFLVLEYLDGETLADKLAKFQVSSLKSHGSGLPLNEALTVVLQHAAGFGQRAALRRPIEQLLAELDLEPAHRLADGRLRAVHLGSGARKAALLRNGEKDPERREVHLLICEWGPTPTRLSSLTFGSRRYS